MEPIYEFRDLQSLLAETCKNPMLLNYFNWHIRIINRWILFTSDIQRLMFRGRFVAFSWSKKRRPAWSLSWICFRTEMNWLVKFFLIIIMMDSFKSKKTSSSLSKNLHVKILYMHVIIIIMLVIIRIFIIFILSFPPLLFIMNPPPPR